MIIYICTMERKLIKTEDGSPTLYVPELNEHYHSIHGAITESEHIFIEAGLNTLEKDDINILEFGMGTGLNVLLSYLQGKKSNKRIHYHTIELYPLNKTEYSLLSGNGNWSKSESELLLKIHEVKWGEKISLSDKFTLYKDQANFLSYQTKGLFDLIYFDAFAPEIQAELWTEEIFLKIFNISNPGAILTTYSAKGQVRRNLKSVGFDVEKLPGPPGKREFLRAIKPLFFISSHLI